jgi:hypothetical protein
LYIGELVECLPSKCETLSSNSQFCQKQVKFCTLEKLRPTFCLSFCISAWFLQLVWRCSRSYWNWSFGPKAQTPKIPYARSGHPPLNTK